MKKRKSKNINVIPSFKLSFGVTLAMLSIMVLIPVASVVVYTSGQNFSDF